MELDPGSEVITLIGSKEGIAHLPLGINDPEDINLMTTPGYPVYQMGTLFAGGFCHFLPLRRENAFLPDLDEIDPLTARDAKAFFFNYPNNPTAAVADKDFFAKVVDFCREHEIIAVHDAAYTELAYDGYQPPSFLEVPGAKEIGIEFHSLSKTYNMTGWRLGMAVGNREVLAALGKIKSNIDSGAFDAIQLAGIAALDSDQSCVRENCAILQERRDILVGGLQKLGYDVTPPKATFYVWLPVPQGHDLHGLHHPPAGAGRHRHHPRQRPGRARRGLRAPGPDRAQGAPGRGPGPAQEDWLRILGGHRSPQATAWNEMIKFKRRKSVRAVLEPP